MSLMNTEILPAERSSVTLCPDTAPQERAPNKKNKSPFPYGYPPVPSEPTPHYFMLIHSA